MNLKLLIVGLDGATFKVIIDSLVKAGKLPTISKLMKEGIASICKSTHPPVTSPAWPSFMTGCNPAKHGVYHFFDGSAKLYTSRDIKKPMFWDILGEYGYKSLVVNVPVTYPPKRINGILITGMLTPPNGKFAYPNEVERVLKADGYIVNPSKSLIKSLILDKKAFDELVKIERKRTDAIIKLTERFEFDLVCVVYQITDIVQHMLWDKKDFVFKAYEEIDKEIGKLVEHLSPENIIIISDHGFSSYKKQININQFLFEKGLLKRQKKEVDLSVLEEGEARSLRHCILKSFSNILAKIGITQETVITKLPKQLVQVLRKILPAKLRREILKESKYSIDFKESLAYSLTGFEMGIRINKDLVKDYEKFREELIKSLSNIRDLETGEEVFEWVKKKEEVYDGEYLDDAPDIIYKPKEGYYPTSSFGTDVIERNDLWGHDFNGIFIAWGKHFKNINIPREVSLYDIAPTVLAIFGIKPPEYMDGNPLVAVSYKVEVNDSRKIKSVIKKLKFEKKI